MEDACRKSGRGEQTVKNLRKILELAPEVQKAIEKGEIAYTSAIKLEGLSREKQREHLKELKEEGKGSTLREKDSEEGKGNEEEKDKKPPLRGTRAPSKKVLRSMIADMEGQENLIHQSFCTALKFATGDIDLEETVASIERLVEEWSAIKFHQDASGPEEDPEFEEDPESVEVSELEEDPESTPTESSLLQDISEISETISGES